MIPMTLIASRCQYSMNSNCTSIDLADVSDLFPMWGESSKSMIKHSIDIVSKAVKHFNPSQTPVVNLSMLLPKPFSGPCQINMELQIWL